MNKKTIIALVVLLATTTLIVGQIIRYKTKSTKFAEVSSLPTQDKRADWFRQQTPQVKAEVRLAHVRQLMRENTYNPEQLQHLAKLDLILTPEMYSQALSDSPSKPLVNEVDAWCKEARSLFTAEHLSVLSTHIGTSQTVTLEGDEANPSESPCETWDETCIAGRNCKCNGSSWCETCYEITQCHNTSCCCGCFGCCGCNRTGKIPS